MSGAKSDEMLNLDVQTIFSLTFVCGLFWYFFDKWLTKYVWKPLCFWLYNVELNERNRILITKRAPSWLAKIFYKIPQLFFWVNFALKWTGWEDWTNWYSYCDFREMDENEKLEKADVLTPYVFYCSYVIYTFFKDTIRRTDKDNWSPLQIMFDIHHILTIILIYGSISVNLWRAGFLTRLIHESTDLVLYGTKLYEGYFTIGKGHKRYMLFLIAVNTFWWFFTRILWYGILVYQLHVFIFNYIPFDTYETKVALVLWIGSFLMWILQVIWIWGLILAFSNLVKKNSFIDPWHNTDTKKSGQTTKKKQ